MIKVNMETKDGVILNTNGKYCEDYIQITPTNADAISAQNIKEGVTILGVEGALEPSNIDQLISGEITTLNIPNNTTKIKDFTFYNCSSLTSITIPNSVTSIGASVFYNCTSLTDVTIENGFNADGLNLSSSTKYTHDTILSWLNALYDRTGLDTYKFIIGTTNLNKLTDEEKAIATNKNWTLV